MNIPKLTDEQVASIIIKWKPGPDRFLTRAYLPDADQEDIPILRSFPSLLDWEEIYFFAEGIAGQVTCGTDMRSVSYPSSFSEDKEASPLKPTEVLLRDGGGNAAIVNAIAFDRLASKLFKLLIEAAEQESLAVIKEERWNIFVEQYQQILKRTPK